MIKVLFICVHNSARSQMAEAFLNRLGKGKFLAESAGLEPARLNPYAVKVMDEIGYDISRNPSNSVFNYYKEGKLYYMVVKVCDQVNGQRCPIFPQTHRVLDWNIEDPATLTGTDEEILARTREIRDIIKEKVELLISEYEDIADSINDWYDTTNKNKEIN